MAAAPFRRGKGRYKQRTPRTRKNDRIRSYEVRLIGAEGNQIGVVPTEKALELAKASGLDLVEVSANSRPPVCRVMDFGKYQYEQSKKTKDNKSSSQKIKEVKFRLTIGEHDYITKLKRAEKFLFKGNKVKLTLFFRGREMEHKGMGQENLLNTVKELDHIAQADTVPKMVGRQMIIIVSPYPIQRRKLKFNAKEEAENEVEEEDDSFDEEEG